MFTGIVEIIGEVSKLDAIDPTSGGGTTCTISNASAILGDCHDGDSISVNGTCLTVTSFTHDAFKVGIAPETLRRTNLGSLAQGSKVNLERAVSAATRMGGHFVQGHVDTVAKIASRTADGEALTLRFEPREAQVLRYVVEKGFVTVDGASLTVTSVADTWFEVMLIAYTQEKIVTAAKREGDLVNVEVDMVGKYVEKNVSAWFDDLGTREGQQQQGGSSPALDRLVGKLVDERLKAHGLLR